MTTTQYGYKYLLIIFAALAFTGCGGGDSLTAPTPVDITFTRPYAQPGNIYGALNGKWPAGTYTVRTQAQWRTSWESHDPINPAPLAIFDFTNSMVLGISFGEFPSGCAEVRITRVQQLADSLRVEYRFTDFSAPGTVCNAMVTPVFDFVQIPRSDLVATFVEVRG